LTFAAMPELFTIHAGSLDTPELFHPSVVTYNVRALEWDAIDPQLAKFEKMPPALWNRQCSTSLARGPPSQARSSSRGA
jgi:hypothetical protein